MDQNKNDVKLRDINQDIETITCTQKVKNWFKSLNQNKNQLKDEDMLKVVDKQDLNDMYLNKIKLVRLYCIVLFVLQFFYQVTKF